MKYPSPQQNQQEEEEEEEDDVARREWDFTLSAAISPTPPNEASDVIGAIDIDPTDRLLATGGIARRIRIYRLDPTLRCEFYLCAPAKLSSLRWRPDSAARLVASGDYDGVVTEYDAERRVPVAERDEHGGRRVWSVDYSKHGALAASGSDDGTAQLWDPRVGPAAVAAVNAGAAVCSVEYEKEEEGVYLGLGCADRRAYVYDVRSVSAGPVAVLAGHRRTVTYVRFEGRGRLVTSSTDGSHMRWDLSSGATVGVYSGHANARSFVGMSVWRKGGLIACGSESNDLFVYDLRWRDPIWVRRFGRDEEGFVSAVCWREVSEDECALVAGSSDGVLQVFAGRRKI